MASIRAVTVFCSSSSKVDRVFFDAATELGRALAREHWKLVYGGNDIGLMGALAAATRQAGGKVIGVTPQLFVDKDCADNRCDELVVTEGMRQRKAIMEARGDAFVAMPGGLGTFEEFFEIVCGKILGYHQKPIVLLNVANYYGPLLAMIEHGLAHHFIRSKATDVYFVARDIPTTIAHIRNYTPPQAAERTYETTPSGALE